MVSLLLTFFSVGIGIGSLLCRKLGGSQVNIKMVPIGAVGLTVFAFYLALSLSFIPTQTGPLITLSEVFHQGWGYYHVMIAVTLLGISGGFYIVPLYAMMQAYSPCSHRARVVAANNILNAVFMVSSAIFSIIILSVLQIDIKILFCINCCTECNLLYLAVNTYQTFTRNYASLSGGLIHASIYRCRQTYSFF